jgi:hypothetical protein
MVMHRVSFARALAVVTAIGVGVVGVVYGTYAAGGSDSSCYSLMAEAFASKKLQPTSELAVSAPWPNALATFTPGGFVPAPNNPAGFAPVCAPGFSVLLAPFAITGGSRAIFYLTPLAGALLAWLTFVAARALGGPLAGVMAAVLVATSPAVLFQVVQPMNDVTTAALWVGTFAALGSRRFALGGVACGLALLVRPNLLPLAALCGLYVIVIDWKGILRFAAGALPFGLLVLWLNARLYGSPFATGYGQPGRLFALSYFGPNAARYLGWLVETHTPFLLLGVTAPFLLDSDTRAAVVLGLGLAAMTYLLYSVYTPFSDWSYLRFLLIAIAMMSVLASASLVALTRRMPSRLMATAVVAVVSVAIAIFQVRTATDRFAFRMRGFEQRYRSAGLVIREQLPPNAVLLSVWDSGAVRFHGGREALVWEALDPMWLDRALAWLDAQGRHPYVLVESWEEPRFRERFGRVSDVGKLDWPPQYEIDRVVRIFDPQQRSPYLRGERVGTEYLWPLRR